MRSLAVTAATLSETGDAHVSLGIGKVIGRALVLALFALLVVGAL